MSQISLPVALSPNGGLMVASQPTGETALVTYNRSTEGELSATLYFAGSNQAVITFDAAGSCPVSYMMFNCAPSVFIERSVANIVQYLSQQRIAM